MSRKALSYVSIAYIRPRYSKKSNHGISQHNVKKADYAKINFYPLILFKHPQIYTAI